MAQRFTGLVLIAVGVAGFLAGLFGLAEEWSIFVFAVGLAILVAGLVVLISALRHATALRPRASIIAIVTLGVSLHAYESLWLAYGGPSPGFLLWGIVPYILCVIVAIVSTNSVPATLGAVTALLFDLLAHYQVFVNPTSSTAGLALVFTPLWNTLVFVPVTMLVTWLIYRHGSRLKENAL